jgi:uncharacterized protein (TIGR03435 family)
MNNTRPTCTLALFMLLTVTGVFAQTPAAPGAATHVATTFEVASIKPSNPNPDPNNPLSMVALMLPQPGGRFTASNTPLRTLIMTAYELQQEAQLVGGQPAQLTAKYDINARTEGGTTIGPKELPQLLRTLLADRFKLKTHTESREMPVYDLVLARSDGRLGPDIKPSTSDCAKANEIAAEQAAALAKGDLSKVIGGTMPCTISPNVAGGPLNLSVHGDGQEIGQLIALLSQLSGRTVRDKTGLTGRYDFDMKLDLQAVLALAQRMGANIPAAAANIPQSDGSSLMTALKDQLGLKLDAVRATMDVVIIDSVEAPIAD